MQAQTSSVTDGYSFLLMGRRVYSTPTSINCHLVQKRSNQMLFAIPLEGVDLRPQVFADENSEDVKHATILVRPGESIRVTLRIVSNSVTTPQPFCSADPESPDYCFKKLVIRTQAQAPNAGETDPREDSEGTLTGPDLTLFGTVTPVPTIAGRGGFVDVGSVDINNVGNESASDFSWSSYLLSNATGLVGTGVLGGTGNLDPEDGLSTGNFRLYVPLVYGDIEGGSSFPPGSYAVGVQADYANQVEETNENNNRLESAAPITVAPYQLAFTIPPFATGASSNVEVALTGDDGEAVSGATVTLTIEGPNAVPGIPGPPFGLPPLAEAVTNADGRAIFPVSINTSGVNYRFVATVSVVGVGQMKFQSGPFPVVEPIK